VGEEQNMAEGSFGTLDQALDNGMRLLASEPAVAEAQARAILKLVPNQPKAQLLLGAALRAQRQHAGALDVLEALCSSQPDQATAFFQLGLTRHALGRHDEAVMAFRRAVSLAAHLIDAWRVLGDVLLQVGDRAGAEQARRFQAAMGDPAVQRVVVALRDDRPEDAQRHLQGILDHQPDNPVGLWLLADLNVRLGRHGQAERLLARCLAIAPDFDAARRNYAIVLFYQAKERETLVQIEWLLSRDPDNPSYRLLQANTLTQIGEYEQAQACLAGLLAQYPSQPKEWIGYGQVLKTLGRKDEAVAAFSRARALMPGLGQAWWSLKTYRFEEAEIRAMEAPLTRLDLTGEDRVQIHFALGKALEDADDYAHSFEHYQKGAMLHRASATYDADATTAHIERSKAVLTPAFFAERAGAGCPAPDPIFIVGLPRAGLTLVEQILSSHSAVEGTMELPNIPALVRRLGERTAGNRAPSYPGVLLGMGDAELAALGEAFIRDTRSRRKLGRPFFIDKMPNNFAHIGLIHTILPNAKIIDMRRDPMGNCFSAFKQHFARGQYFSYDLTELGRYYVDYARMMDHVDTVLPGLVHRIRYERLVADPEGEVRALLTYCGLPFEEACLRFHENDRPVRTPSAEQVRQPIFSDAVEHWRNYEPWLGPLKAALAPVLKAGVSLSTAYRG
jgi:tetratricopeptide (TPR) repeat protein